jgi:hypothetical protein
MTIVLIFLMLMNEVINKMYVVYVAHLFL